MYKELKPKGVAVISVSVNGEPDSLRLTQRPNNRLPIAIAQIEYDTTNFWYRTYRAGVKTWYVVDPNRKVLYAGSFSPRGIRAAVQQLGVSWPKIGKY